MDTPLRLTCICILDSNGERICAQYPTRAPPSLGPPCPYRDFDSQRKFEGLLHQGLMNIRGRTDAEALQVEGEIAVGLDVGDVSIFAVSPESSANELLLLEVVEALRSVLSSICKYVTDLSCAVATSAALVGSYGSGGGTGGGSQQQ
ncbi:coatomer zeta-2 subunit, putative [Eimeria necatrix]|uniref:Coatomer zeta-2 subunit, putative n=1 Tax=Eimeria necatrix TaxID=51315 RepID=U6MHU4_9EIME|nr:coatomer zeta-2 subunit, putative [Eimeria necatrix]CDJ63571.1 coatomer zeta-2 subunit, putative [Eimeria necatrix]